MEKTLTCQICGKKVRNLASHVEFSNGHPSWDEYKEKHPNAKAFPDDVVKETLQKGKGDYWSEEEEEILKERYPQVGSHIPELKERGRSEMAIKKKAERMGLQPFGHSCERWTEEEEEILREKYPTEGSDIPKLLNKGRTKNAIQGHAYWLGIDYEKRDTNGQEPWTEEEVEILREQYPKKRADIPELLNRGRSKREITGKAKCEGITYRDTGATWTDREVEILKREFPRKGSNIPKLLENGRTRQAIATRAHLLGVTQNRPHYHAWTKQEEEILKENYPKHGSRIHELLNKGFSKKAINCKAGRLGITKRGPPRNPNEWTKEEIGTLREEYPTNGGDIPQLKEGGRTEIAIRGKAQQLGIQCNEKFYEKNREWMSRKFRGKGNPFWKGGYEEYYGPNWVEQRKKARERDNHTCQNCGKTKGQEGQKLDVHHIIPFREFNSYKRANQLNNLISFCMSCHRKAENEEIEWLNKKEKKLREKIIDETKHTAPSAQRTLQEYC